MITKKHTIEDFEGDILVLEVTCSEAGDLVDYKVVEYYDGISNEFIGEKISVMCSLNETLDSDAWAWYKLDYDKHPADYPSLTVSDLVEMCADSYDPYEDEFIFKSLEDALACVFETEFGYSWDDFIDCE
jgi:hypothetical protein